LKEDLKSCSLLKENHWEFFDHIADRGNQKPNYWHPLYIRRPLLDVINGHVEFKDQASTLLEQMKLLFNLILGIEGEHKLDSFMKLRNQLSVAKPALCT
jgi:hypothetical protein